MSFSYRLVSGQVRDIWLMSDGVNISLPYPEEEMGDRSTPWPHVDQSPLRRFKHCIQGIMNLVSHLMIPGSVLILVV